MLLHELRHALTGAAAGAAPWALAMPAARADDDGPRGPAAARLEDPAWVADALAVPAEVAAAVAAVERAARRRCRAGLGDAAARAERAAYRDGGPPPWRDALAWTDPGASASYAAAEAVRDRLDGRGG
ncbi:MAG: hypothetical protein H6709_07680 [Kofleriaceae bacterium]|nr:hypothetical protein [Kofleriaceae bacterium]